MKKLEELEKRIRELFKDHENVKFPVFGIGYPAPDDYFVEINDYNNYVLYYMDWRNKSVVIETRDIDELIFTISQNLAFTISNNYERKNRIESIDNRIILFAKQVEILEKMNLKPTLINALKSDYNKLLGCKLFNIESTS